MGLGGRCAEGWRFAGSADVAQGGGVVVVLRGGGELLPKSDSFERDGALLHKHDRAKSSPGAESRHPIIWLSGIPRAVIRLRILHPIVASTLCVARPLARIAGPKMVL